MLRTLPSKSGPPEGAIQQYVESTFGPIQEVIGVDDDLEILVATDVASGCSPGHSRDKPTANRCPLTTPRNSTPN